MLKLESDWKVDPVSQLGDTGGGGDVARIESCHLDFLDGRIAVR